MGKSSPVNMLDAKTHLSRLIAELEEHPETEVVISRYGRPAARLVAYEKGPADAAARIGAARGAFQVPGDIDSPFGDLAALFAGTGTGIAAPGDPAGKSGASKESAPSRESGESDEQNRSRRGYE